MSTIAQHLKDKLVMVAGAGRSGLAACRFLSRLGAKIVLADDVEFDVIASRVKMLGETSKRVRIASLKSIESIQGADFIVLSPGISRLHPTIREALAHRVPVINEIDLASSYLPGCRFIGVTGTNGKSTTTTILGSIAKAFDNNAFVGGNLGLPLCEVLAEGQSPQIAVLELSSYQLETLSQLKLKAAIVTNLAPDHLDRYPSESEYYLTKAAIFKLLQPDGIAISNQGNPLSKEFLAPKTLFRIDFNTDPQKPGIGIQGNELAIELPSIKTVLALDPEVYLGTHNRENAAAAVAGALALGIPIETIQSGLNAYKGIAHRLETLGFINGIRWINDSKATNVDSATVSVKSFEKNIHLIVGGLGKKSSYEPLVQACKDRVKAVYAIGQDGPKLFDVFANFNRTEAKTLENAVLLAQSKACPGDVILLAPGCASFDQFENFEHRGNYFRTLYAQALCQYEQSDGIEK